MTVDKTDEISIGVTAFKARCLALIDDVAQGKTRRVLLTKHNQPIAAIVPVEREPAELWGAMRGTVRIPPGTDLTRARGKSGRPIPDGEAARAPWCLCGDMATPR